ncbi:hypothetical protein JOQ06_003090, partial [Pogonophryne albipinna]
TAAARWDASLHGSALQTQRCLGLLCSTRLRNFIIFRGCSFLGGPHHVSAP